MTQIASIRIALTWIALFLLSTTARAETTTEDILELIRFDAFVESVSAAMQDSQNAMAESDHELAGIWSQAARDVFPPQAMLADISSQMRDDLTPEELTALSGFLAGPLGQRITLLEVEAQRPENADALEEEGARLLAQLISSDAARLGLYTDLVDALGVIDSHVTAAMNINFAIMSGMAASQQMPYQLDEGELLALIAEQRDTFEAIIRDTVYTTFAYSYAELSEDELAQYVDFLKSGPGRALYASINRATETVLSERARVFGMRLMDLQQTKEL